MGKQVQDRPLKKSASSSNPDRVATGPHQRSKSTIKRLQMYKSGGKVVRNRQGRVLRPAPFQTGVKSGEVARVEPNRKWFGNTKVITQSALQTFQEEMGKVIKDPYKVIMRKTGLPISLLQERSKHTRVHLLDTESFKATFGQHSLRKRPKLFSADLQVCRFFLQDNLKTLQDHAFKGRMQYIVMAIRNITKDRVLEMLLKIGYRNVTKDRTKQ
jgi:hypothetical protein